MFFSNKILLLFILLMTPGDSPHVSKVKANETRRRGNAAEEEKRRSSSRRRYSPSPAPSLTPRNNICPRSPVSSEKSHDSPDDPDDEYNPPTRKRRIGETAAQKKARLKKEAAKKRAARNKLTDAQKAEIRKKDTEKKRLARKKETTPQRESRLGAQLERTTQNRSNETPEAQRARQIADVERKKRDISQIRETDALRHRISRQQMRAEDSSDSEDDRDDIQPPKFVKALDIGPRNPCKYCGALLFGKELYCCSNGAVWIAPLIKLPKELYDLFFGGGPTCKQFRLKILKYNIIFSMASLAKNNEYFEGGLPVQKVKGAVDAYPSAACPYPGSTPAYANFYLYDGQEAVDRRMEYTGDLDEKVVKLLQAVMKKHNVLGKQYRTLKEVMDSEKAAGADKPSRYVRMKIINAWDYDKNKLQNHKGIYKRDDQNGKDYVSLFYKSSPEQVDIELPGLVIFPYRSSKAMRPLPHWLPIVDPLCYPLFFPFGQLGFVSKRFPRCQTKKIYWERMAEWMLSNKETAADSELLLSLKEVLRKANKQIEKSENSDEEVLIEEVDDQPGTQETVEEEERVEYADDSQAHVAEEKEGLRVARHFQAEGEQEVPEEPEEEIEPEKLDTPQPGNWDDRTTGGSTINVDDGQADDERQPENDEDSSDDEDDVDGNKKKPRQKRKWISQREWLLYMYQQREHIKNVFLNSGKLGQLYLIHGLTRILRGRYAKYREHYTEKIKTTKMKFLKAMEKKAENKGYNLGIATTLPKKIAGSPRWLQERFENAVALANRLGKIDLFITLTCNVNWPEIKDNLEAGQTWADNPFLVNNVFRQKMEKVKELIVGKKNAVGRRQAGIFGKCRWFSGSVEFQSRGPPHVHMVVSLKRHVKTVAQIDKICQATFPEHPELRDLVESFMVHSPCQGNPKAYCRKSLKFPNRVQCGKNFPKEFSENTKMGDRTYPELKRPDDGEKSSKNPAADCRYIVPYNGTILSAWRGHANVEVVSTLRVVKYIFKYIFKGFDRVLVETVTHTDNLDTAGMTVDGHILYPSGLHLPPGALEKRRRDAIKLLNDNNIPLVDEKGRKTLVYDETVLIQDMRVLTSCEAAWDLAKFPRHLSSHFVMDEYVHEEDQEPLLYDKEDEEKIKKKMAKTGFPSKLKAWFKLNQEDEDARKYTYQDIPCYYTYRNGKWVKKKKIIRNLIGRILSVPPRRKEAFAIRLLCQYRRGIKSFKELRTVDGTVYSTYAQAAKALGLMNDQREWMDCMREAASSESPCQLRRLFMQILTNNIVYNPLKIYNTFKEDLLDNRKSWSMEKREAHALYHMRSYLSAQGKTLADFNLPDVVEKDLPDLSDLENDSGRQIHKVDPRFAQKLREGLKDEQIPIFDKIFNAILKRKATDPNIFFLQGSGGTGKTVLMKALYYNLLAAEKNVACVAHTGIAASLLPGGTTAHRHFHIPLLTESTMNCQVELESSEAYYLSRFHVVIWDEATMSDNRIYESVDKLMRKLKPESRNHPFGGTVFILAGDWKQTLPIDPEARSVGIVRRTLLRWRQHAQIKYFQLTTNRRAADDPEYAAYLEKVGLGVANIGRGLGRPEDETVKLPTKSLVPSEYDVIHKVFGYMGKPEEKFEYFKSAAILAVDNKTTFDINDKALKRLLNTTAHKFRSVDTYDETTGLAALDPECYHQVTPSGMPPHELNLKVGAVVILLRNINVALGLTNGTRLVITHIGQNILRLKHVRSRRNIPEEVILGKMLFASSKPTSRELSFTRKQFPLRLAFAITVNRAQGQTLERAGLILRSPCFSHGQLYVALSRVRTPTNLFIYNCAENPNFTNNVVFPEVIAALKAALSSERGSFGGFLTPVRGRSPSSRGTHGGFLTPVRGRSPSAESRGSNMSTDSFFDRMEAAEAREAREFDRLFAAAFRDEPMDTTEDIQIGLPRKMFKAVKESVTSTSKDTLLLANDHFFCFANTAVQVLYRLFKKEILEYRGHHPVMKELQSIVTRKYHTGGLLTKAPGGPAHGTNTFFNDQDEQNDAEEYLLYLLTHELPEFDRCMEYSAISIDTCPCGEVSKPRTEFGLHQALVQTMNQNEPFNYYLRSCETDTVNKNCKKCGKKEDHSTKANLCIPQSLRFMRLAISRFTDADDPNSEIIRNMEAPKDIEIAFGYRWKPVVMVAYTLLSRKIRHYTVYLKIEGGWLHVSDTDQKKVKNPDMNTISLVVLEKIGKDDMRESVVSRVVSTVRDKLIPTFSKPKPKSTFYVPSQTRATAEKEFVLFHGDMFSKDLHPDVVVNAANPQMQSGGGVCGDIFRRAGPDLDEKCQKEVKKFPGHALPPGTAVTTDSCDLTSLKCIVHTAAPDMRVSRNRVRRPDKKAEQSLRLCYINSLRRAAAKQGERIIFPILGIGIYGYDHRQGLAVAIQAIFAYFEAYPKTSIRSVTFAMKDYAIYSEAKSLTRAITRIPFTSDEARGLRMKIEHDFEDKHRSQDVEIPDTAVRVASFAQ